MSNNITNNKQNNDIICTICHEKYDQAANVNVCECGHLFHYDCLQQWLMESANCPICRIQNPGHFKVYFDFEASAISKTTTARNTNKTEEMSEYENMLYESRLYRDEISYLNARLAEKEVELLAQKNRSTELERGLHSVQRSIMENDVYDEFVVEFINTLNELDQDSEE